jgi:lipoprotein-anchoring transpeptidase ErfK/SrfK
MRRRLLLALAALLLLPATASAADGPPVPRMAFGLEGAYGVPGGALALAGDRLRVNGTIAPYVAGDRVLVRLWRSGKVVDLRRVAVSADPDRDGQGRFTATFVVRRTTRFAVEAEHAATAQLGAAKTLPLRFSVVTPAVRYGERSALAGLLQQGLRALRYEAPSSGRMDAGTARAVLAYRKVNRWRRTFAADAPVVRGVLAGRGAFRARFGGERHVEGDLSRQVLALVDAGGRVYRVFHTSSGAPRSPTVRGAFRVYRKQPGTNSHGMVYSSYFIRGYAVHGYASVPPYNASHGCLRVPIPNAVFIYRWMTMGTRVNVY